MGSSGSLFASPVLLSRSTFSIIQHILFSMLFFFPFYPIRSSHPSTLSIYTSMIFHLEPEGGREKLGAKAFLVLDSLIHDFLFFFRVVLLPFAFHLLTHMVSLSWSPSSPWYTPTWAPLSLDRYQKAFLTYSAFLYFTHFLPSKFQKNEGKEMM